MLVLMDGKPRLGSCRVAPYLLQASGFSPLPPPWKWTAPGLHAVGSGSVWGVPTCLAWRASRARAQPPLAQPCSHCLLLTTHNSSSYSFTWGGGAPPPPPARWAPSQLTASSHLSQTQGALPESPSFPPIPTRGPWPHRSASTSVKARRAPRWPQGRSRPVQLLLHLGLAQRVAHSISITLLG